MRILLLLAFALLLIPAVSNSATRIQDIIDAPVPIRVGGGRYSIEEVRTAVIQGSQTRGWTAEIAGERTVLAKLNIKNKHFAEVEIQYSESAYSITYVSSKNLDYNPTRRSIHRNYNKWVLQLSTMINRQFQALGSSAPSLDCSRRGIGAKTEDIFDELLKLDDLRDRGILTDEEFQIEKRKLLERD